MALRPVSALGLSIVVGTSESREADAQMHRDRGEQLAGLVGVHGLDALKHLLGRGRLIALPGQQAGGIITPGRPQLLRGHAGHRGHAGERAGRPAYRRVDTGTHDLVTAGDLPPAPFAEAGPAGSLARRQAVPGQASPDERTPRGRLRTLRHAVTFA